MPMRTCTICKAAENPLGRLKFSKYLDSKIYCANCIPGGGGRTPAPAPSISPQASSAGSLVVIPCPDCRGMGPGLHGTECKGCSGYGSVRIPANFLNVYKPQTSKPQQLVEG
jgi:hypothetical protein